MKKIIAVLFFIAVCVISQGAFAQSGSKDATSFHSQVNDSTTVVKPSGWGTLYYNAQTKKWRITENGITRSLLPLYGASTQIPFSNLTANGFSYSPFFTWDNTKRNILAAGDGATVSGTNSGTFGRASSNAGAESFNFAEQSSIASGCSDAFVTGWSNAIGTNGTFDGSSSFTFGTSNINLGYGSYAGGVGSKVGTQGTNINSGFAHAFFLNTTADGTKAPNVPYVFASDGAGNISRNTTAQTDGNGSLGQDGFILGGYDHHIPQNSPRSIILGGHSISARASEPDQVYVPNFNIVSTPSTGADDGDEIILRNAASGKITRRRLALIDGNNHASYVQPILGVGTITVTSGSNAVSGNGTTFTDNSFTGMSFWLQLWVFDGTTWWRGSSVSVINNTNLTASVWYSLTDAQGGYVTNSGTTYPGVSGTYSYYLVNNFADNYGVVFGNQSIANNYGFAFGGNVSATGINATGFGNSVLASGARSFAVGLSTAATGNGSFSGGLGVSTGGDKRVLSSGSRSFNWSENTSSQTIGNGATAANSAILGGINHHIPSTSIRSAIIGGSGIAARASDPDQIYVPNFNIASTPLNNDALTQVLVRDAATGQVKYRNASSLGTAPSGANFQLQYYNGGAFGANINLSWDNTHNALLTNGIRIYNIGTNSNFFGSGAGNFSATGNFNVGVGNQVLSSLTAGGSNTAVGNFAGKLLTGGGSTLIGDNAGSSITSGNSNTLIGYYAGSNITTGSQNLILGFNLGAQSPTASYQLSIQNAIFGVNNFGVGTTPSSGNIGMYVPNPTARLHLPAGSSAPGTAPLKIASSGTSGLTTPEDGVFEYFNSHLTFTIGTTRFQLDQQGGGGGTPAGSNLQIQFNNFGAFGATSDFIWNDGAKTLTLNNQGTSTASLGVNSSGTFQVLSANTRIGNGTTTIATSNGNQIIAQSSGLNLLANSNSNVTITVGNLINSFLKITGLPTSSAGLPSSTVWNNGGVLSITP